jgi:hypothetical protein
MLINCWHMNEHESAAMWKLYSRSSEAIGIRSTDARLRACLPDDINIGTVKYIDYHGDSYVAEGNVAFPYVHKRRSFELERELRAVMWKLSEAVSFNLSYRPADKGQGVTVELSELTEKIFVAPGRQIGFSTLSGGVSRIAIACS